MEKGSREELEQRLALCGPEDTVRGYFFNGVLEAVRDLEDPAVLNRCIEAAGGDRFMTFFSYPVGSLNRLLYTAAWALSERLEGFDVAMRYLGQKVAPTYLESRAGRVLVLLAGGVPKLMLNGFPSAYRTSVRHGECSVRWSGSHNGIVSIQGSTLPAEFFEGAVRGIFENTRVADVKTTGRQLSLRDAEIDVSW
ncbi:DUF2378 family protein [Vitiosangium sp. GDMCC 1.1324]|uniref:TIGR02265 family protein n=1 Tax=Vitiosangium sp. (strain GDMCC 1.1324) TaxID=2138576 RepID=UPI000D3D9336|nr:DUF2378 family protein [Vitiosangium sp. GDMCC 1.1324]PTL78999.1 TIGR02265 family protein [Vitiosangium sp. GDMCC 1.1324]